MKQRSSTAREGSDAGEEQPPRRSSMGGNRRSSKEEELGDGLAGGDAGEVNTGRSDAR